MLSSPPSSKPQLRGLAPSSFGSLSDETKFSLGMVSFLSGTRPSSLFEWHDPEDWKERLEFDMMIAESFYNNTIGKVIGHGQEEGV